MWRNNENLDLGQHWHQAIVWTNVDLSSEIQMRFIYKRYLIYQSLK